MTWNRIIPRAEKIINATKHRNTGLKPDLHEGMKYELELDERLKLRINKVKAIFQKK